VTPLIERHAPGLVHLILSSSLNHTLLASLSRPVAGTIGKTLIVTLPGSVKAVRENLEALSTAGVLDHALDLIKGGTGASVHDILSTSSSHAQDVGRDDAKPHHHHHHRHTHGHQVPKPRAVLSHNPSLPGKSLPIAIDRSVNLYHSVVTARHRESPYEIVSLEQAIASILHQIHPLPPTLEKVTRCLPIQPT